MTEKEIKLNEWVMFEFLGKFHIGRLKSVEKGIANIKGNEQGKYTKPAYHIPLEEVEYPVEMIEKVLK